jgi:signal transduction histidine kinase
VRVRRIVERSCSTANRLVDDLAVFVRSRSGSSLPLNKSPADLRLICEQVLEHARVVHTDRTFNLATHGDLVGNWDSDRLTQVLVNLVTNAAIHGTEREVDLAIAAEDKTAVIRVTSWGNPIPVDKLESIFDPMVRAGSASSSSLAGGMGLGLFIVREIVSAHGAQ